MTDNVNNIPTIDKVFEPMGPSEIPSVIADILKPSPYAEDDPAWAVHDLIERMQPQRRYLMAMLAAAAEGPKTSAEMEQVFLKIFRFCPIVYSPYDLLVLLEEAGGLARVDAQGAPYDMAGAEPVIEQGESGALYYRAAEPADLYWAIQPGGQTVLDDDDPVGRAQGYFDDDPAYKPLYKRLLTLCRGGATIQEINDAITYDDLVVHPREEDPNRFYHEIYAAFLLDRMERAGAVDWLFAKAGDELPKWVLTDVGEEVLGLLSAVTDDYDPAVQAANKERFLSMFEDDNPDAEAVEFDGVLIDEEAIAAAHVDESQEKGANYLDPPTRTDYIPAF